jgi:hypothetical protein
LPVLPCPEIAGFQLSTEAENSGGLGGLSLTGPSARVSSRFTVAQVDEQRRQPLV